MPSLVFTSFRSTARFLFYFVFVLTLLFTGSVAATTNVPDFNLKDQFGKSYTAQSLQALIKERPLILIAGDTRNTDRAIHKWAGVFRSRIRQKVRIMGLANLDGVPFFVPNSSVRKGLREQCPKTPVLCDWDDELFSRMQLPSGTVTVLVFGTNGKQLGKWNTEKEKGLADKIKQILR